MFNKILSNISFNPSLLSQVSFYIQRMKAEQSIRRLGFVFLALAMTIQSFAVISPPKKSLAYSNDYIINGLNTRDDILRAWDNKTSDKDVAAIYGRFGITREDIAGLSMKPNATIKSSDADYWTIGRTSLSASTKADQIKNQYKDSEVPVTAGSSTVYLRQLRAWDIKNSYNVYNAFEGTKNGKKFWILQTCGNFTQVGLPPLETPSLELRKTIEGNTVLKPGDTAVFRFEYRNSKANSPAVTNITLKDTIDTNLEIIEPTNLSVDSTNTINMSLPDISYSPDFKTFLLIKVRFKQGLPNGTKACNIATLSSGNTPNATSGGSTLCLTLLDIPKCDYDPTINNIDPACQEPLLVCTITNTVFNKTTKEAVLKTVTSSTNTALTTIKSYQYNFGDNSNKTIKTGATENEVSHIYNNGSYTTIVTIAYSYKKAGAIIDKSASCSTSVEAMPDQPLSKSKVASNVTQKLDQQQTLIKKANAGDVIEYNLVISNSFDYDRQDVIITDSIADILEYADIDRAFLSQQGGIFDTQEKSVSWPSETIRAKSTVTKTFRVTVKRDLPATNQPSSLTTSYDCKVSNKFGNQIDITINCPKIKSAEYITTTLPKTGPGTSVALLGTVVIVAGYFYARSRLLSKEMSILKNDYISTGGVL